VPATQSRRIRRAAPAAPAGNMEKSLCTEIKAGRNDRSGKWPFGESLRLALTSQIPSEAALYHSFDGARAGGRDAL